MTPLVRKLALLVLATFLWSCQSGATVNSGDTGAAPVVVTNVSNTALPGTVIYDEVIPFAIGIKDPITGKLAVGSRITGALQSRVTKAKGGSNLIFSYRFRDLTFTYPPTDPPQFIEYVSLDGFDKSFFSPRGIQH